ncbi:MAG: ATP-binding protein, partial [Acidobacteriota bacterium]
LSHTRGQALGKSIQEFLPPEIVDGHEQGSDRADVEITDKNIGETFTLKRQCDDGSWLTLDVCRFSAAGPYGTQECTVVMRDVTEHQRAEEQNQRLAAFPRENPGLVLAADAAGHIVYVNPAAEKVQQRHGVKGIEELLVKNHAELVRSCLLNGRSVDGIELAVNGRTFTWTYHPVQHLRTVHLYGRDTTERTVLERRLQQTQKMESLGQLAGGIAHDFNNLLLVINGSAELARGAILDQKAARRDVERILNASRQAAKLTRQLLAFSRKQPLEQKVIDLDATVSEIDEMLQRLIGDEVELVTTSRAASARVLADPGQLEQVLMNLVLNARDAMPAGGTVRIETENVILDEGFEEGNGVMKPGPYALLKVSDTGYGMDEATRQRIFEPFFTTKTEGQGTGLGLASVYGIVKQHDGYIWVESEVGRGTTFSVYLPHMQEEHARSFAVPVDEKALRGGSETLLVVDDEEAVGSLVKRILERQGYEVSVATGARGAIELFLRKPGTIDLLLTDVAMPETPGPELYRKLLEIRSPLKVLYMSGHVGRATSSGQRPAAVTPIIYKPFSADALARKVRDILDDGGKGAGAHT